MVSVGLGGAGQRICFSNEVLFNFFLTYYFVLGYSRLTNNVVIVLLPGGAWNATPRSLPSLESTETMQGGVQQSV